MKRDRPAHELTRGRESRHAKPWTTGGLDLLQAE